MSGLRLPRASGAPAIGLLVPPDDPVNNGTGRLCPVGGICIGRDKPGLGAFGKLYAMISTYRSLACSALLIKNLIVRCIPSTTPA